MNDRCVDTNDPYNCCTGDGAGTCPTNQTRTIATCGTQSCYDNDVETTPTAQKYCDIVGSTATGARELWDEGCVAYWEDWAESAISGSVACSTCTSGSDYKCCSKNAELYGAEVGMDDLEKPGFIKDCINGLPCVRMYYCDDSECNTPVGSTEFPQNTAIEVDNADVGRVTLTDEFSLFFLWRAPFDEHETDIGNVFTDKRCLTGAANNSCLRYWPGTGELSLQRAGGGATTTITDAGAITKGKWHFIEVYWDKNNARFGTNAVKVYIDHVDATKTGGVTYSSGTSFTPTHCGSATKGFHDSFGDVAMCLFTDDILTSGEQTSLQTYMNDLYAYMDTPPVDTTRGYTARACGFDADRDGFFGEPEDCNYCDGTTIDPDHDGIYETMIYVDCDSGNDTTGDGSAGNPYLTLGKADTVADGPTNGAEEIVCLKGTCNEEFNWNVEGVANTWTLAASGNEQQDWTMSADPGMLVGWDNDDDGEYPPYDTGDTAVLSGAGIAAPLDLVNSDVDADNNYMEFAHFDVDNVAYNTWSGDRAMTFSCDECDFVYYHDLELTVVKNSCIDGWTAAFSWWNGMRNVWWDNIWCNECGGWFFRGQGRSGVAEVDGPMRISNTEFDGHAADSGCPTDEQTLSIGKMWGHYGLSGDADNHVTLIDNDWDLRQDLWTVNDSEPNTALRLGSGVQNAHVENNLFKGWAGALSFNSGVLDVANRRTDDHVYTRNEIIVDNTALNNPICFSINEEHDDADNYIDDVTFSNNLCYNQGGAELRQMLYAEIGVDASDPTDASIEILHNTFYSTTNGTAFEAAVWIDNNGATYPVDDFTFSGNIIAGMPAGSRIMNVDMIPTGWDADYNILGVSGQDFDWGGSTNRTFAQWQSDTSDDANSDQCLPTFVSGSDFHLQSSDTCAKGQGFNLGIAVDFDDEARPQDGTYDIGADEVLGIVLTPGDIKAIGAAISGGDIG
jgi:hypothetical protein